MNEGLRFLSTQADRNGVRLSDTDKVVLIPLHSFIDQLLTSLKKYIGSPQGSSWAEHLVLTTKNKVFSNIFGTLFDSFRLVA